MLWVGVKPGPQCKLFQGGGVNPPQDTGELGHGSLEASVPKCDLYHLVGLLRHPPGQTQVGGVGAGVTA